jgi:diguanylate cyclase (GGDEF)-like protein
MIDKLILAFSEYLKIGTNDKYSGETNHRLFVSNLFSFIGYTITLLLSINAFKNVDLILAVTLLTVSIILFICHQIHRFPQLGNTLKISTRLIFLSLFALELYLIYSGGVANTGPLWIYLVPPVAFFFKGLRNGLLNVALLVLLMVIMLFYPDDALLATHYTIEFKTRLIYSFFTVTLLFGFYEYSRQRSYEEIQALSQKYEQKAMQDHLTKLPNRRGMREHLDYEYDRTKRSCLPLTILVCDIDNFKTINDSFMHDGGDFVLEKLAELFTQTIRKQDYASRWGGEEFLFLLPETSAKDAFVLAEKLRTQVQNISITYRGRNINVTISIGISEISPDINIDQAINIADRYLYQAKQNGRNQVMPTLNSTTTVSNRIHTSVD